MTRAAAEQRSVTRADIEAFALQYLTDPSRNVLTAENAATAADVGITIYDAPLVCTGLADDPLWEQFKQPGAIGAIYRTPREWLPGAKSVISVFAPFSEVVRQTNTAEPIYPSSAWVSAYRTGGALIKQLSVALAEWLNDAGYRTVAPAMSEGFRFVYEDGSDPDIPAGVSYASNWSERHAAFVCGHGTFGLSRGIITRRGMAGRFSSVVTDLELEPDERIYEGLYDFCILCGKCMKNCPPKAITEKGKEHTPCNAWLTEMKKRNGIAGCCGKCQVNVPCSTGIPAPAYRQYTLK